MLNEELDKYVVELRKILPNTFIQIFTNGTLYRWTITLTSITIVVIDKPNAGYGHTINRGFERASGEYVVIVESDDFVEPDVAERMYTKVKEHDADIIRANNYEYNGEDFYREMLKGYPYDKPFSVDDIPNVLNVDPCNLYMCRKAYIQENEIMTCMNLL